MQIIFLFGLYDIMVLPVFYFLNLGKITGWWQRYLVYED